MKLPTMEELYEFYKTTVTEDPLAVFTSTHEFNLEVAFYHGWMAALDRLEADTEHVPLRKEYLQNLRDIANAEMAATIGG